jgi:hypothetical protein
MAIQPSIDLSLDNATLAGGVDNASLGQILAQLKIITVLLREGLNVQNSEDLTLLQQNSPFQQTPY